MIIHIVVQTPPRRWHLKLVTKLRAVGHEVHLVASGARRPTGLGALAIALDQRAFGPKPSLFDTVDATAEIVASGDTRADLVIAPDDPQPETGKLVLTPLFDGKAGDHALIRMIVGSSARMVSVDLFGTSGRVALVTARLAIEHSKSLSRSLDLIAARVVTLIAQSILRAAKAGTVPAREDAAVPSRLEATTGPAIVTYVMTNMALTLARRLPGVVRGPHHWRIGYRHVGDPGAIASEADAYTLLPDDGQRFFADPIVFARQDRLHLFFEDYPYASGKGVIGHVEIDEHGAPSRPQIVLERPHHLSYPFVIEHKGEIYMMPEMSSARRIQLFRADPFPARWVPDRVLIDGVGATDATPVYHQGRWWIFATFFDDGGSSWDQLCLFHAPDLLGPWEAHTDNPVLVDAGCARPAGPMWHVGGTLMRVAQDCRRGYGDAVVTCRVDRLDPFGYAQSVVGRFDAPAGYGAEGTHTFGCVGGFEVIDLRFAASARRRLATPRAQVHG